MNANDELIPVTVTVLGRNYKLKAARSQEAALRKAAETIDAQAKMYGKSYVGRDNQDLLAMAALGQATELIKIQENLKFKDSELIKKMAEIDSALDNYLHPIQNSL